MKKKAQEEIVGFVLIVVLVSVIALIFLAISIRKPSAMIASREIENFLHASMLYTTSCQPSSETDYDFKDLVGACYKNEICLSNEQACEVLNKTAFELIERGFQVEEGGKVRGYIFKIYDGNETLAYLDKGVLAGAKFGSEILVPVSGENLYIKLELYY